MAKTKEDSPKAFLVYESTYNQLKKYFSPAQAGEFLMLMGEYMLYDKKDVESADPMVDMLLQMNKPILDAAEKRHKQAVENGMKGAEYGKDGGAPKGNQNARKKKEEEKQPQNNPQSTPEQPLKKEIEYNKEIEIKKQEKIKNNIDINNDFLFSNSTGTNDNTTSAVENENSQGVKLDTSSTMLNNSNGSYGTNTQEDIDVFSITEEDILKDVEIIVAMQEERIDDRNYNFYLQRAIKNYSQLYEVSHTKAEIQVMAKVNKLRMQHLGMKTY